MLKFIVCTSTLAQGVNLPIRYLIFTNIYQAGEKIRVEVFHNLIGRAGRSGLQTEGTILFADPEVYDKRGSRTEGWRFGNVLELFSATAPDPCTSSLLTLFDPLHSADKKLAVVGRDILPTLEQYYVDHASMNTLIAELVNALGSQGFDEKTLRAQLKYKLKVAGAVESYLISALEGLEGEARVAGSVDVAKHSGLSFGKRGSKGIPWRNSLS